MKNFEISAISCPKGMVAVVTGANTGLGYETALELAKKGIEVVLACRNQEKSGQAEQLIRTLYPNAKLKSLELDLSKPESVRSFVDLFLEDYQQLNLLINNAGIMMPPYQLTREGFESQFATNFLGHFLLTGLLLPTLEKTKGSRVVTLSSIAHWKGKIHFEDINFKHGYNSLSGYRQSKLACLMFAYELNRKLVEQHYQTKSIAAHPGIVITRLIDHFNPIIKVIANFLSPVFFQSATSGALPILRAALDPETQGGEYYGPDGFRQFKGLPVAVTSSLRSKDQYQASKLWKLSEKLTDIRFLNS